MARNYAQEYARYQSSPDQIKKRSERNQARAELAKAGVVHKGDGKDVDHIKPLVKGGNPLARGNLRAIPASQNRSFKRTKSAGMK
jgi:hypothetical protein